MICKIDKNSLFGVFGVTDFSSLASGIDSMAPSLAEYYLSCVCCGTLDDGLYINRRNISNCIHFGQYSIMIDYADELYLEYTNDEEKDCESLF